MAMNQTPESAEQGDRSDTLRAFDVWKHVQGLSPEDQIDRLAGDAELVETLAEAHWAGEEWDFVAQILAEYGLSVIGAWIRQGKINAKCSEKNIKLVRLPEWVWTSRVDCDELTNLIVATSIRQFQTVILPRGLWKPAKGAALSTYFIGQCLIQYPNAAQAWLVGRSPGGVEAIPVDDADMADLVPAGQASDREDEVLTALLADALLSGAKTDRGRRALEMKYFGYSQKEIAEELACTVKAVAQLLDREKRHLEAVARDLWESQRRPA